MPSSERDAFEYIRSLRRYVREHEKWRTKTALNLMASENYSSPEARNFLSSDLSNRYTARDGFYRGTKYIDDIEALAVSLAKKVYNAKFADVRPLSGHTCSLILFLAFLRAGNSVVTCPPSSGGYPGSSELGLGPLLSLRNLYFPYDEEIMNIIPSETRKLLHEKGPEMTIFGSSFIPFPYDIKNSLPEDYEGVKVYDGSHVMGLIAGGEFQQPLEEGCSVLMGSTHKSFFGPQGGIILSNDEEIFSQIESKIYPGIVDNIHWNRVAALAFCLAEFAKFGKKYASQVTKNSQALAKALDDNGIPVRCSSIGYTKSHQVLLGFNRDESVRIAKKLETLDIITDSGIRFGTSEVTRRGMRETEMNEIASIVSDALSGSKGKENIAKRVHQLVRRFSGIEYSLSREA